MSPGAPLAGCACASGTATAATLPAANMPCRKPLRSFVLESIVVVLAGLRLATLGLYDNYAPSRRLIVTYPVLLWARPGLHQVALYQVRIPNSRSRRQASLHQRLHPEGHRPALAHHDDAHALQRRTLWRRELQEFARPLR